VNIAKQKLIKTLLLTLVLTVTIPVTATPQESNRQSNPSNRSTRRDATEDDQEDAIPLETPKTQPKADLITIELIDEEKAKIDQSDIGDGLKGEIQNLYIQARQSLATAKTESVEAAVYREQAQAAPERRQELRTNLDTLNNLQKPNTDYSRITLDELNEAKRKLETAIESNQELIETASAAPGNRQASQLALPTLEEDTQNELTEIRKQLAVEAPDSDDPMLTRARMVALRARRQKLDQDLDMFKAKREFHEATEGIPALEKELATRNLERNTSELKLVQQAIGKLRKDEIKNILKNSRSDLESVGDLLKKIAERNLELVETLQQKTDHLQTMKLIEQEGVVSVEEVKAELVSMRSRVEAIGLSYEVGSMLRRNKTELVSRKTSLQDVDVKQELPKTQLNIFQWQDFRKDLADLDSAAEKQLADQEKIAANAQERLTQLVPDTATEKGKQKRLELLETTKTLLNSRLSTLEKLEDIDTEILNVLTDVQSLKKQYTLKRQEFADFLDERILWVRSEPVLGMVDLQGVSDIDGIWSATKWLIAPDNWRTATRAVLRGVKNNKPGFTIIAIGLLGLIMLQPRSRGDLRRLGAIAAKRGCREFSPTATAMLQTIVLASFWPAVGLAIGWLFTSEAGTNMFVWSIGRGLTLSSLFAIPIELLRCTCRDEGLAENHFSWSEGFRNAIRKHTGWFIALGLPLLFLIITIESANNSNFNRMGRVAILVLLGLCIVYMLRLFALFRPGGTAHVDDLSGFDATVSRIRSLLFIAVTIGFGMLILFAVMGYYESVYKIAGSFLQTASLLIGSIIAFALAMRFLLVRRRKLRFEQLIQQRKAAIAAAEKQAQSGMSTASEALEIDLQNEAGMDITDVSRQARELTAVIFLIAIALSLLAIWQYLLPATKILDGVVLWPITIGTSVEFVTARDLLLSLLVFALTFFSVRNIPGMLELLLLQRLPLDAGARYAVASIFRYILLVVGVIIALGYLKIPWSNYSWLVAAISVGLGFGLQEIVANFVSGLILLLERPVRVGDVVTIDGVTGVVSRIQMRATTVTNWDNQELVVPNKDLISGKLLNWTLSSVINRIALKVGVAYGTDVAKVREILNKIIDRHPDILKEPQPIITFQEFGDSSLNFVIRCCTTSISRRWHLIDEVNSAINEAFEREGIEIPFPQRVVHMVEESPDSPAPEADSPN
jgi:potassium efflux system protein